MNVVSEKDQQRMKRSANEYRRRTTAVIRSYLLTQNKEGNEFALQLYSVRGNTTLTTFSSVQKTLKLLAAIDNLDFPFDNPNQTDAISQFINEYVHSNDHSLSYVLFAASPSTYRDAMVYEKDMSHSAKILNQIGAADRPVVVIGEESVFQEADIPVISPSHAIDEISAQLRKKLPVSKISVQASDKLDDHFVLTTARPRAQSSSIPLPDPRSVLPAVDEEQDESLNPYSSNIDHVSLIDEHSLGISGAHLTSTKPTMRVDGDDDSQISSLSNTDVPFINNGNDPELTFPTTQRIHIFETHSHNNEPTIRKQLTLEKNDEIQSQNDLQTTKLLSIGSVESTSRNQMSTIKVAAVNGSHSHGSSHKTGNIMTSTSLDVNGSGRHNPIISGQHSIGYTSESPSEIRSSVREQSLNPVSAERQEWSSSESEHGITRSSIHSSPYRTDGTSDAAKSATVDADSNPAMMLPPFVTHPAIFARESSAHSQSESTTFNPQRSFSDSSHSQLNSVQMTPIVGLRERPSQQMSHSSDAEHRYTTSRDTTTDELMRNSAEADTYPSDRVTFTPSHRTSQTQYQTERTSGILIETTTVDSSTEVSDEPRNVERRVHKETSLDKDQLTTSSFQPERVDIFDELETQSTEQGLPTIANTMNHGLLKPITSTVLDNAEQASGSRDGKYATDSPQSTKDLHYKIDSESTLSAPEGESSKEEMTNYGGIFHKASTSAEIYTDGQHESVVNSNRSTIREENLVDILSHADAERNGESATISISTKNSDDYETPATLSQTRESEEEDEKAIVSAFAKFRSHELTEAPNSDELNRRGHLQSSISTGNIGMTASGTQQTEEGVDTVGVVDGSQRNMEPLNRWIETVTTTISDEFDRGVTSANDGVTKMSISDEPEYATKQNIIRLDGDMKSTANVLESTEQNFITTIPFDENTTPEPPPHIVTFTIPHTSDFSLSTIQGSEVAEELQTSNTNAQPHSQSQLYSDGSEEVHSSSTNHHNQIVLHSTTKQSFFPISASPSQPKMPSSEDEKSTVKSVKSSVPSTEIIKIPSVGEVIGSPVNTKDQRSFVESIHQTIVVWPSGKHASSKKILETDSTLVDRLTSTTTRPSTNDPSHLPTNPIQGPEATAHSSIPQSNLIIGSDVISHNEPSSTSFDQRSERTLQIDSASLPRETTIISKRQRANHPQHWNPVTGETIAVEGDTEKGNVTKEVKDVTELFSPSSSMKSSVENATAALNGGQTNTDDTSTYSNQMKTNAVLTTSTSKYTDLRDDQNSSISNFILSGTVYPCKVDLIVAIDYQPNIVANRDQTAKLVARMIKNWTISMNETRIAIVSFGLDDGVGIYTGGLVSSQAQAQDELVYSLESGGYTVGVVYTLSRLFKQLKQDYSTNPRTDISEEDPTRDDNRIRTNARVVFLIFSASSDQMDIENASKVNLCDPSVFHECKVLSVQLSNGVNLSKISQPSSATMQLPKFDSNSLPSLNSFIRQYMCI